MYCLRKHRSFWRSSIDRALYRLRRNQEGALALEMAFVAPLLVLLVAGVVEFGHAYMIRSEMTAIAREGVRRLAVDAMSRDEAEKFIHSRLAKITKASVAVDVTEVEVDSNLTDITLTLSVPLSDVTLLELDHLLSLAGGSAKLSADKQAEAAPTLSTSATMMKE